MSKAGGAQKSFKRIEKARPGWANEAELRKTWVSELESVLGVSFDMERAKNDLSYNNVIIEFKAPGFFKGKTTSAKFIEATQERLLPYITKASAKSGLSVEDYIGIAIDGDHVCFAQVVGAEIKHGHLLPFSPEAFGMVLDACRNNFRRAVTAENLLTDFGHTSEAAAEVMQALSDALASALKPKSSSKKIKMLFEEWRALYGQVADLSSDQLESIDRALRFDWKGASDLSMPARLFVIHSYNSLVIKLLAAEIVAAHGLSTFKAPAESFCALMTDEDLVAALDREIERGALFSGAGINGFVEEAIFSWHLDAAKTAQGKKALIPALRALIGKLSLYRTDRLTRQRDALRDFYQGLVPETLRKSLGEFYTPDWLVDFTVSKAQPKSWLGARLLDPTCGSGSFLVEALRRKRAAADKAGWDARKTLEALRSEVWGFDLNPLAVQTARVNFLMEIADLLAASKGEPIELPVLLADAIYSPAQDPTGADGIVEYKIGSQVASLTITLPSKLAFERDRLDAVFETMGAHVEDDQEYPVAAKALIRSKAVTATEAAEWEKPLSATYNQVLALHRKNWNGIWFRIVRNFFWSATAGKFDVIVGNPPWVRWSRLPEAYRERVKPTCEQYDIFSKTGHHGGNELDISAMITYTTGDKWLRAGGRVAFVITQTLFQNPSSAGFRNFRVHEGIHLAPVSVDDLKALKPFPDAANKTAVAIFHKTTDAPAYPVPYTVWEAAQDQARAIKPELSLPEVLSKVIRKDWEANPVGAEGSPWAVLPKGRFDEIRQLAHPSDWVEGRKGITVDLNGVYFVPVLDQNPDSSLVQIETQPSSGKKDIGPAKKVWIEPDWLYPLIKGASDFGPCYLKPDLNLCALVPNKGIKKSDFAAASAAEPPATKKYFNSFKKHLEARSTWKSRMSPMGAPNYAIYNVGDFTFKPWKVIWAEMPGRFCAAVAGSKSVPLVGPRPYVPDHKIFFVALDDETEAHYLCGLLNSATVAQYVEAHNVAIQVGDIFKHMRLPRYEAQTSAHKDLADLTKKAHQESDETTRAGLVQLVRDAADKLLEDWIDGLMTQERQAAEEEVAAVLPHQAEFLSLLDKDISGESERVGPIPRKLINRIKKLVGDVKVDLDADLGDEA
ncbi:putative regulator PrlF [mine drainage metagenome]|uniref:site-specific DNA-methyltransferase (adenine-specific) n=1 Tax=mine drainage metagenome TaxID=410659 RepID=A0A1J5TH96_9ZZZZ